MKSWKTWMDPQTTLKKQRILCIHLIGIFRTKSLPRVTQSISNESWISRRVLKMIKKCCKAFCKLKKLISIIFSKLIKQQLDRMKSIIQAIISAFSTKIKTTTWPKRKQIRWQHLMVLSNVTIELIQWSLVCGLASLIIVSRKNQIHFSRRKDQ